MSRQIFCALAISFLFVACGPMNMAPKGATERSSGEQLVRGIPKSIHLSEKSKFLVHVERVTPAGKDLSKGEKLDNTYLVRIIHASDLTGVSDETELVAEAEMPTMPDMGTEAYEATREKDGTFSLTVIYSMNGKWSVRLKIKEGKTEDVFQFDLEV